MTEPSQSRVDLSGIHPLKRVTLIVMRYLIGVSLAAAFGFQFIWFCLNLHTGWATCTTVVDAQGLLVFASWPVRSGFIFNYRFGLYNEDSADFIRALQNGAFDTSSFALPGLPMIYTQQESTKVIYFKIGINHFWLIGLTVALYFFTRWRIRRSARIQNQPS